MNKLTKRLSDEYQPFMAIVAYKGSGEYYLESHDINKKGNLLEGRPLKQVTVQRIFESIAKSEDIDISGEIPEHLLYFKKQISEYKAIWYRREEKRIIHFSQNLNIDSGTAWIPALIYVTNGSSLSVFAMNSNKRPVEKTKIFLAPFHNVSANGSVCLGSAKLKFPEKIDFNSLIYYWETLFWSSEFSHMAGGSHTKSNMNLVWKRLVENPDMKWADIDELKGANITYKQILGRI